MINHYQGNQDLENQAKSNLIKGIIWLIPFIIYIFLFLQGKGFQSIWHLAPMIFVIISSAYFRKRAMLISGIKGERNTLDSLKQLQGNIDIFSSIKLNTKEGRAEIDKIIVSEKGVFVVEVKNHNGTIEGDSESREWTQHKVGRKGGEYSKQIGNPTKQVRRQVFILSKFFKENGIDAWIEGAVFFSNPEVRVHVRSDQTPVFSNPNDLNSYLMNYAPRKKLSEIQIEKIRKTLIKTI